MHKPKCKKELKEREAFDENRAADADEAKINFKTILEIMERIGFIDRTSEGKIFITKLIVQALLEVTLKTFFMAKKGHEKRIGPELFPKDN